MSRSKSVLRCKTTNPAFLNFSTQASSMNMDLKCFLLLISQMSNPKITTLNISCHNSFSTFSWCGRLPPYHLPPWCRIVFDTFSVKWECGWVNVKMDSSITITSKYLNSHHWSTGGIWLIQFLVTEFNNNIFQIVVCSYISLRKWQDIF